jgi:hypothetical protein
MAKKPDETIHLKLRLPEALRKQIERAAAKNERSMNSEIIHLLQQALRYGDMSELINAAAEAAIEKAEKRVNFRDAIMGKASTTETEK